MFSVYFTTIIIMLYAAFIELDPFVSVAEGDPPLEVCVSLTEAQDGVVSISSLFLSTTLTGIIS